MTGYLDSHLLYGYIDHCNCHSTTENFVPTPIGDDERDEEEGMHP